MVGSSLLPCLQFSSVSLIRFSRPTYTVNVTIACTPCSFCAIFGCFYFLLSFPVVLTEVLVSRGIVMSMRRQVLSFLFFSTVSGLLAAMVLSVWMDMSHRMVTLSFSVTALGSCSYHRSFASIPNSLQIFQWMCAVVLCWRSESVV